MLAAARLSDDALLARLKSLAIGERDATVEVVAHLSELDGRRIHLGQGPGSVYKYCRDVLGYSEDAAWNRAAAANVVRRFPIVLSWLADGSLNVTTVRILRGALTAENHLAVLTEARRRSKKDVELIEARLNPKSDAPSTIRRVVVTVPGVVRAPQPAATVSGAGTHESMFKPFAADRPAAAAQCVGPAATSSDAPGPPPAPAQPPAPATIERYRVQLSISKGTHDKLRRLQELLCREVPDGDPAVLFDRALDALLNDVEKKKLAAAAKPRTPRGTRDGSRRIPAYVTRAVWKRDEGQCAFIGPSGRCTERRFLERHHVQPFGHQGPATEANISLRCRAHNVYESEQVFGRFDPSIVREKGETYRVSRGIAPFRNGGSRCDSQPPNSSKRGGRGSRIASASG
jgi:hypothetical protein